jgi:hypothetical protein
VQLGRESPDLAEKYNSKSIAEQNSVDVAWDLLMRDEFCELRRCLFTTKAELMRFRQLIVNGAYFYRALVFLIATLFFHRLTTLVSFSFYNSGSCNGYL